MEHTGLTLKNARSPQKSTTQCPLGIDARAFLARMVDAHAHERLSVLDKNTVISCMLCGQCANMSPPPLSPHGESMTQFCVRARQYMVENNTMPQSTYGFALDELHASTRRPVTLFMGDPYHTDINYAFFPGCQLSGARWKQVLDVYAFLRTQLPMGLMLSCCGTPAQWAGHDDLVTETAEHIVLQWNTLGQPTLVMACASCVQFFQETMPHIPCVSLWELLHTYKEHMPLPPEKNAQEHTQTLCIQDPCGARHNKAWHESTRLLAQHCGVTCAEAVNHEKESQCCGYGGLVWCARPDVAEEATEALVENLGEHTTLASCIMCRDRLVNQGKACLHLFDILPILSHSAQDAHKKPLSLSAKRINRVRLAREIMDIYGTSSIVQEAYATRDPLPLRSLTDCALLHIEPTLLEQLERKHILHQDAAAAVRAVEAQKTCFLDTEGGHSFGAWQSGTVTFWVRYSKDANDTYQLHDAWRT